MLSKYRQIILTLVLLTLHVSFASADPHTDAPTQSQQEINKMDRSTSYTDNPYKIENISITEVQTDARRNSIDNLVTIYNRDNYYYPYRKEFSVYAGVVLGVLDSSDDDDFMNYIFGFNYLLPQLVSPRWSVGAELSTVSNGHVHVAKRHTINEKGAFRPYFEYGGMHKFVPDEKMASLSNKDNYLFWGAIGFSDIRRPPKSVQFQLMAAVGLKDVLIMLTGGYAWGF